MKILKRIAARILKTEIKRMEDAVFRANSMAVITASEQKALATVRQENEDLKVDLFQSSQLIAHHEKRIRQMAPEKQFLVVAVDGTVLEQEMVYSSDGKTRITVRLPIGHPWKQATELAQQLELANETIERAKAAIGDDPLLRRRLLGLETSGADGK